MQKIHTGHVSPSVPSLTLTLTTCTILIFTFSLPHQCSSADLNSNSSSETGRDIFSVNNNGDFNQRDTNDLDVWEPPLEFQKSFPYYLSGFDEENRPIWIAELGKWNIRKVVEEGKGKIMEKYIDQILYRFTKSIPLKSTENEPVTDGVAIVDMEDYDLTQIASLPTLRLMLKKATDVAATAQRMQNGFFVNANFIAENFINLVKPILGSVLSRVEIYGTNREKWIPKLLKILPKESLPEWYGGVKNFSPVIIYG